MKARESQAIQLWPSGRSLTFSGDPENHPTVRQHRSLRHRLRDTGSNGAKPGPWRAGKADEWRSIRIEVRARRYAERDILANQCALVDDLIKASYEGRGDLHQAFGPEEMKNLRTNAKDWDADKCREWLQERGISQPDKPTIECPVCDGAGHEPDCAIRVASAAECTCHIARLGCDNGKVPDPDADEDDSRHGYLTELREAVNDHAEDAEVFEWYLVTSWLCGQLEAIGEVVIDNGYGHWWGRTCTGQALIMDGTLQQIAARYEDRS